MFNANAIHWTIICYLMHIFHEIRKENAPFSRSWCNIELRELLPDKKKAYVDLL